MCGPHSDLFLALAVLQTHREPIIRYLQEFDEVSDFQNINATPSFDSSLPTFFGLQGPKIYQ
jgi:hypothetical protein